MIPSRTFAPISIVAVSPNVISVHPSVPAKTMKELIEVIKANPGKYSFAAPGVGSTPHLSGEIFRIANDLDLPTVQFTGAAPAIQATVGGHTPIAFSALPPAAPQIQQGLLRGLAVTAEKRSSRLARGADHGRSRYSGTGGLYADGHFGAGGHAISHHRSIAPGDRHAGGSAGGAKAPR